MKYDNFNPRQTKAQRQIVKDVAEVSHDLAYFLSWKVIRPVAFSWGGSHPKYVIFYADQYNSVQMATPEEYKVGKTVVHREGHILHIEVNFERREN